MDIVIVWLIVAAAAAYLGKRLFGKCKTAGTGANPCEGCACGGNSACARRPNGIPIHPSFQKKGDFH